MEYAENGNLYLPATRLDGIQKYAGAEAKKPKLNRLGEISGIKPKPELRCCKRDSKGSGYALRSQTADTWIPLQ